MKIIVPNEAPEKMGKALTEAFELIGTQLNEIADKCGAIVSIVAYPEKNGEKYVYVAVSNDEKIVNCFFYYTGENAKEVQKASVLTI